MDKKQHFFSIATIAVICFLSGCADSTSSPSSIDNKEGNPQAENPIDTVIISATSVENVEDQNQISSPDGFTKGDSQQENNDTGLERLGFQNIDWESEKSSILSFVDRLSTYSKPEELKNELFFPYFYFSWSPRPYGYMLDPMSAEEFAVNWEKSIREYYHNNPFEVEGERYNWVAEYRNEIASRRNSFYENMISDATNRKYLCALLIANDAFSNDQQEWHLTYSGRAHYSWGAIHPHWSLIDQTQNSELTGTFPLKNVPLIVISEQENRIGQSIFIVKIENTYKIASVSWQYPYN